MIVFLDGHFKIQTSEFTHVTMGEGVFSSEDGTNFEDSFEVRLDTHLLVELGRLGKTGILTEILQLEDVGTTFGRATDKLGSVDFDEILEQ